MTDCHARLPFRFGAATICFAPMVTVRVLADVDGSKSEGFAADLAMPRWFDKNPAQDVRDDVRALVRSAVAAGEAFTEAPAGTPFELWLRSYRLRSAADEVPLVVGFGLALVERALMDAVCRASELSFFQALRTDRFGFRPERVHRSLAGWSLAERLGDAPRDTVRVRHTIGLADPLTARDLDEAHRVADGLPETLEEDVQRYGLTAFKIKVGGDVDSDARRLARLAELLPQWAGDELFVTLDANEQYGSLEALNDLLGRTPKSLSERIAYVEQPFHRTRSFESSVQDARLDLIIDEADGDIEAFPNALARGYRGVSVKNCKGVFRAMLNAGLCAKSSGAFQSAEDLTNLPVVALQQDLATVAALGLEHVERNGHHYFRGLDHLPTGEVESACMQHSDLYREHGGSASLRIENGELRLGSIEAPGFGYSSAIDFEARTPLAEWSPPGGDAPWR